MEHLALRSFILFWVSFLPMSSRQVCSSYYNWIFKTHFPQAGSHLIFLNRVSLIVWLLWNISSEKWSPIFTPPCLCWIVNIQIKRNMAKFRNSEFDDKIHRICLWFDYNISVIFPPLFLGTSIIILWKYLSLNPISPCLF